MTLTPLDSENIAQIVFTISTPEAIRAILRNHKDIKSVRQQLLSASDAQIEIEEFVRDRLIDLKHRIYFSHEPAFCALAVTVETLPMKVAEKFLSELSELKIAEMPISSRVAALCLQRRRELLIPKTQSKFQLKSLPLPKAPCEVKPHRITTESKMDEFKVAA